MQRSQTVDAYPTAIQPPARFFDRWLATRLQQVIAPAAVRLELWDGSSPYSRDESPIGSVLVHDRAALLGLVLDSDLRFGDAYTDGRIDIRGDLVTVVEALTRVTLGPQTWRERRLQTSPATVVTGSLRGAASMLAGVLSALALLILATAASNLGGLFLARAAAGRKQAAIHLAIGSGRAAIIRRHAIEGAFIGLAGAALALGVYAWTRVQLAEIALLPTLALRLDQAELDLVVEALRRSMLAVDLSAVIDSAQALAMLCA